jgi:hypothetical protein
MGLLDEAIREHLDLKRRRGADASEVSRQEQEALGPARRGPEPLEVPADHDAAGPELDGIAEGHDPEAYHEPEHAELEQPVIAEPAEHFEPVHHEPEAAAGAPAAEVDPEDQAHAPPQEPHDFEPVPEPVAEPVPEALPEPAPSEQTMAFDVASEIAQEEAAAAEARRAQPAQPPAGEPYEAEPHEPAPDEPEPPTHAPEPAAPSGHDHQEGSAQDAEAEPHPDDVLEETPEFLQETPEHDRLWFEQRPPKDFDFDK